MLQAVKTVSSALNDFYGTLNDEQKARFEAIGPQRTSQLESLEVAPTTVPPAWPSQRWANHSALDVTIVGAFNSSEFSERLIGMIMPWDATPLSNRRPTYSRPIR